MLLFSFNDPQFLISFALGFLTALALFYLISRMFQPPYDPYHNQQHGWPHAGYSGTRPPQQGGIGCLLFLGIVSLVGLGLSQFLDTGMLKAKHEVEPAPAPLLSETPTVVVPKPGGNVPEPAPAPALGLNKNIYEPDAEDSAPIPEIEPRSGQYFLQKGIFRQKAQAESACRGLQNLNLPACIVWHQGQWAACAGPYPTRAKAEAEGRRWKKGWEVFGGGE